MKKSERADREGAAQTPAVSAFAAIAGELARKPAVETSRMFGSDGLKVDGKVFAMVVKERLVVKLAASRVRELLGAGVGVPFDPGHGKVMKEWVSISAENAHSWMDLAKEAMRFVRQGGR